LETCSWGSEVEVGVGAGIGVGTGVGTGLGLELGLIILQKKVSYADYDPLLYPFLFWSKLNLSLCPISLF